VIGIRDYLRKMRLRQVCGWVFRRIDSAVTCCLAAEALGTPNVLGWHALDYSSTGSVEDARLLAHNLGLQFESCRSRASWTAT